MRTATPRRSGKKAYIQKGEKSHGKAKACRDFFVLHRMAALAVTRSD
jgi:hypothetical protein